LISPATLLAASIKDRRSFDAVKASGESDSFTGDHLLIWSTLCAYYARDIEVLACAPDNLAALAVAGVAAPKSRKRLHQAIEDLGGLPASPENIREAIAGVRRERVGTRLAVALSSRKAREEVDALIAEWQETWTPVEEEKELTYEEALRSRNDTSARMTVYPLRLNKELGGGVLPGHHIILFARPEQGKSACAITMAVGFARKGHRVLYLTNEDPKADLMTRAITAITKKPRGEITSEVLTDALKAGLSNVRFVDVAPGSLAEIEAHVRRDLPAVMVIDQLRNIHAGKTENLTQRLDTVAQGIRALAKRYGLVAISVTQAGDSARDKAILDDGDIDSSNTGIPAAADVLLGIGGTAAMRAEGSLMMTLCKNKVAGTHNHFTVRIDPLLSLVRSYDV
jgi:archaellum biogenesis ATPase FlaH